ncbi:MAG: hypothetical protein J4F35_22315 [Candidatus Latescibacteria bacterium]|nr:hypothetical protein [Candidatus Latescibacterota bacterium]
MAKFLCASPKRSGQPTHTSNSLTGSSNSALKYIVRGDVSPVAHEGERLAVGPQAHLLFDKGEHVVEPSLYLFVEQQTVSVFIDADFQEIKIVQAHAHFERSLFRDQIRVAGVELVGVN